MVELGFNSVAVLGNIMLRNLDVHHSGVVLLLVIGAGVKLFLQHGPKYKLLLTFAGKPYRIAVVLVQPAGDVGFAVKGYRVAHGSKYK